MWIYLAGTYITLLTLVYIIVPGMVFPLAKEKKHNRIDHRFIEGNDTLFVYCHGNGEVIRNSGTLIDEVHSRHGFSTFMFDYPGYGKSGGKPSEKNLKLCAEKEMKLILNVRPWKKVIVYGCSLGGYVATYISTKFPVHTLILEVPLTRIPDIVSYQIGSSVNIPFVTSHIDQMDTIQLLYHTEAKYKIIFGGKRDTLIPIKSTRKMKKNVNRFIEFDCGHNGVRRTSKYWPLMDDILTLI